MAAPLHYWGTGRRKTSVARVRVKSGSGKLLVNGRTIEEFFPCDRDRVAIRAPLTATQAGTRFDILARLHGGGTTGQAGALVMGIARALVQADASLESTLRDGGFLTRDSRMKERKKYGQKGARARFQFSTR